MENKIYIAGAISNRPQSYKKEFMKAEIRLKAAGNNLIMNPAILPPDFQWSDYMPICFAMLNCCNIIYMLKGWEKSKGACMERARAEERGMKIIYEGSVYDNF